MSFSYDIFLKISIKVHRVLIFFLLASNASKFPSYCTIRIKHALVVWSKRPLYLKLVLTIDRLQDSICTAMDSRYLCLINWLSTLRWTYAPLTANSFHTVWNYSTRSYKILHIIFPRWKSRLKIIIL